ncbi:MAG: bacteriohemerythrin [Bacteroidales bacterium]|nr:MAG: bacteriohemerythrin [Bacteroidales bacterium]
MGFFNWDAKYAFNIESIDNEHKALVGMIDELYTAMKNGNSKNIIKDIVQNLITYTKVHFRREEMLLKSIGYTDFVAHEEEHDSFIAKVSEFKKKLDTGKTDFTIEVASFLRDWLTNHILVSDKKYVAQMKRFNIN